MSCPTNSSQTGQCCPAKQQETGQCCPAKQQETGQCCPRDGINSVNLQTELQETSIEVAVKKCVASHEELKASACVADEIRIIEKLPQHAEEIVTVAETAVGELKGVGVNDIFHDSVHAVLTKGSDGQGHLLVEEVNDIGIKNVAVKVVASQDAVKIVLDEHVVVKGDKCVGAGVIHTPQVAIEVATVSEDVRSKNIEKPPCGILTECPIKKGASGQGSVSPAEIEGAMMKGIIGTAAVLQDAIIIEKVKSCCGKNIEVEVIDVKKNAGTDAIKIVHATECAANDLALREVTATGIKGISATSPQDPVVVVTVTDVEGHPHVHVNEAKEVPTVVQGTTPPDVVDIVTLDTTGIKDVHITKVKDVDIIERPVCPQDVVVMSDMHLPVEEVKGAGVKGCMVNCGALQDAIEVITIEDQTGTEHVLVEKIQDMGLTDIVVKQTPQQESEIVDVMVDQGQGGATTIAVADQAADIAVAMTQDEPSVVYSLE